jgi:hypothetical protein
VSTYAQLDGIEMVDGGRTEELHHVHTHVVIGRPAAGVSASSIASLPAIF